MAKETPIFDEEGGSTFDPDEYQSTTRVALHHRYQVPFAYTLEMSFGGLNIDPKTRTQLTPDLYREAGAAALAAMALMPLDQVPPNALIASYILPVFHPVYELIY
jgi:hypothetical protein